jgi:hypothetical protein
MSNLKMVAIYGVRIPDDVPPVQNLMPHNDGYPFKSRDYSDIDCKATVCQYNFLNKCITPSRACLNAEGRCEGFQAREISKISKDA